MSKRYLRLDIEYDTDESGRFYMPMNNIQRILSEDMPYCKIIFSRDTSKIEDLDYRKREKI